MCGALVPWEECWDKAKAALSFLSSPHSLFIMFFLSRFKETTPTLDDCPTHCTSAGRNKQKKLIPIVATQFVYSK